MQNKRRLLKAGVLVGALSMLLPAVVLLVGMRGAYATLGASGIGDPAFLSRATSEVLVSSALLLPCLLGGLILLVLSLVQRSKLRRLEMPILPPTLF